MNRHAFTLECSNVHYQPIERDLLIQYLLTQEQETSHGGNNLENLKTPDDRWKVRLIEEDFPPDVRDDGEKLLDRFSESLNQKGVSRCDRRELYRYRQFYLTCPRCGSRCLHNQCPNSAARIQPIPVRDYRAIPFHSFECDSSVRSR